MNKIIFIKDTTAAQQSATDDVFTKFAAKLKDAGLDGTVSLVKVADAGLYFKGVVVKILPDNIIYANVKEADFDRIINETLKNGRVLEDLKLSKAKGKQQRIVLRNCGRINPESIDEYIAQDGYHALRKTLFQLSPEKVIEELKEGGLRGRGGGGFPTWMKWNFAKGINSGQKYIICNGDEGDPGAYMDRSVLEGDPHAVIEGMIIAGYTIGASKGFCYIRAEYPLAIERLEKAMAQAYEYGLLGENILDSGFDFDLEIRLGAGAFVCGEETALIASIEGKRGTPRPRPPYPSVRGLWGYPTVINNVETLANIAPLIRRGGKWFGSIGMEKSKGTKVFALTGKVANSGLIEVPMGTTLREIVFDIGGGVLDGLEVKAVQTGGPSGGVIPKDLFDTPVSYENLQQLGSIMGSGGMIVMDETDCMVDISKFYLGFCVDESCGKCAPCRLGGYQMLHTLTNISEGKGQLSDIVLLKKTALAMQKASLCGLGQTAPNPVISTIRYFEAEYREHIQNKRCHSHKCEKLLSYVILAEKCVRCGACFRACPVNAISGSREKGYVIDQAKCIKCGRCFEVCKFDSVLKS